MPLERKLEELLRDKDSKLELYKTSKNLNNVNRKKSGECLHAVGLPTAEANYLEFHRHIKTSHCETYSRNATYQSKVFANLKDPPLHVVCIPSLEERPYTLH